MKQSLSYLTTFLIGAIIFGFASILFAWTGPTQTAPNGNVSAPVNVGAVDQVKNAGLSLNSLAVFGNTILSGVSRYLNFGTIAGSSGYGIRDNAGVMEFKHSGGSWTSIVSNTVQGGMTTGYVTSTSTTATSTFAKGVSVTGFVKATSGFTFPDGTTQTTAVNTTFNLYNNNHTNKQCESKGGLVRSIGSSGYLCQITGSTCGGGGWTRLDSWGVTHPRGCVYSGNATYYGTGSHEFANSPPEQAGSGSLGSCSVMAALVAVGCY